MTLALLTLLTALGSPSILPDPALTPGDTISSQTAEVCSLNWARNHRNVSENLKALVFRRYQLDYKPGEYEVDHLIPLELGGSNSVLNLWPQPAEIYKGGVRMGFHEKDHLENELHRRVCYGGMPLLAAQAALKHYWTNAYRNYLGPFFQGPS